MSMLGTHRRGGNRAPSPKPTSVHETVIYPRIKPVTVENNPCLNPNMESEHILACGHLINTVNPNEPCAPNCHHVKNSKSKKKKELTKEFYCDACVEAINETFIPEHFTSTEAERMRGIMRRAEARNRRKDTEFRKCYIAFKVSSVPCHSDGSMLSRYVPRTEHHPYDRSLPQIGENMFEDIEIDPPKAIVQKKKEQILQKETETSSGEITEGDLSAQDEVARTNTTLAAPSTATMQDPDSKIGLALGALSAQPKGSVHKPRTANRAARNSPSVVIPSAPHKSSSRATVMKPQPALKPASKRKRSATDESSSESNKESQAEAPRPAKRAKATPSAPVANKPKAPLRRSTRLSNKKAESN